MYSSVHSVVLLRFLTAPCLHAAEAPGLPWARGRSCPGAEDPKPASDTRDPQHASIMQSRVKFKAELAV